MPFKGSAANPVPGRNPCRFMEIPEFPVGSRWDDRRQLCDAGVHGILTGGIHGRGEEGAFSVVLSGGYADDVDVGEEFTYTGQGGQPRREVGEKWSHQQVRHQEWIYGNKALQTSCRTRKPVRVIRGSRLDSPYAPVQGYRYDGLYTVEEATMKVGIHGFNVCLFRFRRRPNQAPLPGAVATRRIEPERQHTFASLTQSKCSASSSSEASQTSDSDTEMDASSQQSLDSTPKASSSQLLESPSVPT